MLLAADNLSIDEIVLYYEDTRRALIDYFDHPTRHADRFANSTPAEIVKTRFETLAELERSQSLTVLAAIEAMFRVDFEARCKQKMNRPLVRQFRQIKKDKGERISFNDDVLAAWANSGELAGALINNLRGALRLRNWLAHGRRGTVKLGQEYSLDYLIALADAFAKSGKLLV